MFSESALLETMVKRWYTDFKRNHTEPNDAECSGQPNFVVISINIKKLVLADCKLKLHEITGVEDIGRQCIHFAWTFFNEKAVFKMGVKFAHNQLKTMRWQFRALFATVQSDQTLVRFWLLYFGKYKVFCSSIILRKEEPSIANII